MRRSWRYASLGALLVSASVLLASHASARGTSAPSSSLAPAAIDSLRSTVRRLMAEESVPSLALAVAQHGRIVWEEGFGLADMEQRKAATPTTLYSIASITKPLTATALLTLAERRKVDLDRPANLYLGAPKITVLTGDSSAATVRRVLSHSAGLPAYSRFYFENDTTSRPDLDRAIARYAFTAYPPGVVYDYSNLGYGIVARMIERVSGRRYEDYMREEVFQPLGMPTATIGTGAGIANAAVRYQEGKPLPFYDTDHRGASGAWVSAHELIRFAMFQLGDHLRDQKRILSDRAIESMHHVWTPGDTTQGYGLGFDVGREDGRRLVEHNGGMPGVEATLRLYPDEDLALVVLTNSENQAVAKVADAIRQAVHPARPKDADSPETFTTPSALQGQWTGSVRTFDGTKIPIAMRVKPDDVHVRLGGAGSFTTVLNQPRYIAGIHILTGVFAGAIPTEDTKGHAHFVLLTLWFDGERLRGNACAILTDLTGQAALPAYAELTRSPSASR